MCVFEKGRRVEPGLAVVKRPARCPVAGVPSPSFPPYLSIPACAGKCARACVRGHVCNQALNMTQHSHARTHRRLEGDGQERPVGLVRRHARLHLPERAVADAAERALELRADLCGERQRLGLLELDDVALGDGGLLGGRVGGWRGFRVQARRPSDRQEPHGGLIPASQAQLALQRAAARPPLPGRC